MILSINLNRNNKIIPHDLLIKIFNFLSEFISTFTLFKWSDLDLV